jgi:hypothetical protein
VRTENSSFSSGICAVSFQKLRKTKVKEKQSKGEGSRGVREWRGREIEFGVWMPAFEDGKAVVDSLSISVVSIWEKKEWGGGG